MYGHVSVHMIMCASSAGVLCPAMHCVSLPLHVPMGHVMH